MSIKKLYIIAGPNGAGKTTASYRILPDLWKCKEFVNADEIARGLSPFSPESVAIEAGKIQLQRIQELLKEGVNFSIETTLSTRTYKNLIKQAHDAGYFVELLFFYLPQVEDAIQRVNLRVLSGGHNIPEEVIRRRYESGLRNLFSIYMPLVDSWLLVENKNNPSFIIAKRNGNLVIKNELIYNKLVECYGK